MNSVFASLISPVVEVRVWDAGYPKPPGPVEWLDLHNLPSIVFVVKLLDVMYFLLVCATSGPTNGKDAILTLS